MYTNQKGRSKIIFFSQKYSYIQNIYEIPRNLKNTKTETLFDSALCIGYISYQQHSSNFHIDIEYVFIWICCGVFIYSYTD